MYEIHVCYKLGVEVRDYYEINKGAQKFLLGLKGDIKELKTPEAARIFLEELVSNR